jgi:hypothetical protein
MPHFYHLTNENVQKTGAIAPASGEGIVKILDTGTGPALSLDFIGTIVGKVQKQGLYLYGDTDPHPRWYSDEGGFMQIVNTWPQKFEISSLNIAGDVNAIYAIRILPGQNNENFLNVSGGFGMRDRDGATNRVDVMLTAVEGFSGFSGGGRLLTSTYIGKLIILEFERVSGVGIRLYVNGVAWNGGQLVSTGEANLTEFVLGGNTHMTPVSWIAGGLYTGARSSLQYDIFRAYIEYFHGSINSYPRHKPLITFPVDSTAGPGALTWNAVSKSIKGPAYTFHSVGAIEGASECSLYSGTTSSTATAVENRTWIMTKDKVTHGDDFDEFFRGVDYGAAPGVATNVMYFLEYYGIDSSGRRQTVASVTQEILDNQP